MDNEVIPGKQKLVVKSMDMCIEENGREHYTSKYWIMNNPESPTVVVRRGQPFKLILKTNRKYAEETDGISFIFTAADEDQATPGHRTLIPVPLLPKVVKNGSWTALLLNTTNDTITVSIKPTADTIVGEWKIDVDTKFNGTEGVAVSYSHQGGIYVLFNPWCKKDQVYMKSDEWREECVLLDTGLIWRGSYNRLRPTVWKYAQFEKNILECSLLLISKVGKVLGTARADAVQTVRALSAAVNSADDNGAIMGNWSEDHEGGTPPTKWIGSMDILQKYYKKRKPVKYGQCWVFSGVLTTSKY